MKKRIVLALGGNALQKHGEATAEAQKRIATQVGKVVADLSSKYEIIIAILNMIYFITQDAILPVFLSIKLLIIG